jgi:hypothetical protein
MNGSMDLNETRASFRENVEQWTKQKTSVIFCVKQI